MEEKADGMISRADPGLCIDFPSNDPSVYYAGTEVCRCSLCVWPWLLL